MASTVLRFPEDWQIVHLHTELYNICDICSVAHPMLYMNAEICTLSYSWTQKTQMWRDLSSSAVRAGLLFQTCSSLPSLRSYCTLIYRTAHSMLHWHAADLHITQMWRESSFSAVRAGLLCQTCSTQLLPSNLSIHRI